MTALVWPVVAVVSFLAFLGTAARWKRASDEHLADARQWALERAHWARMVSETQAAHWRLRALNQQAHYIDPDLGTAARIH